MAKKTVTLTEYRRKLGIDGDFLRQGVRLIRKPRARGEPASTLGSYSARRRAVL